MSVQSCQKLWSVVYNQSAVHRIMKSGACKMVAHFSYHAGGGLKHGSIVQVDDQAQHFKVSLVVSHQVRLLRVSCITFIMCITSSVFIFC